MGISSLVRISRGVTGISRICGRMMRSGGGGGSPWLMLRPLYPLSKLGDIEYRFYNVEKKQVVRLMEVVGPAGKVELWNRVSKFVGSSHGFLASFNKNCGSLSLTDVVRRDRFELPSLTTARGADDHLSRVLISSSPKSDKKECRALMIYGKKQQFLALCVPRHSDRWSHIDEAAVDGVLSRKYESISYSNTRRAFFCIVQVDYEDGVGATTELESWDLSDPVSPSIRSSLNLDSHLQHLKKHECSCSCSHFRYLELDELSDQLFLVVRYALRQWPRDANQNLDYPYKTVGFDVYKIDIEQKLVSHLDGSSLDGLALFVGVNQPVAVRPGPASRLQPNSIYFTDLPADSPACLYIHDGDNGVFNYESRTFSSLYHLSDSESEAVDISLAMREMLSSPFPLWYNPMS